MAFSRHAKGSLNVHQLLRAYVDLEFIPKGMAQQDQIVCDLRSVCGSRVGYWVFGGAYTEENRFE